MRPEGFAPFGFLILPQNWPTSWPLARRPNGQTQRPPTTIDAGTRYYRGDDCPAVTLERRRSIPYCLARTSCGSDGQPPPLRACNPLHNVDAIGTLGRGTQQQEES